MTLLKASRLAKRSSFWNDSGKDCKETDAPDENSLANGDVPLYDQLTSLKTWKEETAELCAAEEGRASYGSATAAQGPLLQQHSSPQHRSSSTSCHSDSSLESSSVLRMSMAKKPRPAGSDEILPRQRISEDSAMPLTRTPGLYVKQDSRHDWRQHLGTLSTHFKAASMDKAERTFGRSSFTCARPYEAKQQRPRRRTFIMADLQPTSNSHVALVESDDFKSFTDSTGSLWTVGNAVLKNIMGSSLYQSTAGVCCS